MTVYFSLGSRIRQEGADIVCVRMKKATWALGLILLTLVYLLTGCAALGTKTAVAVSGPVIDGEEAYHVIVAGGEPEGIAAAVAAARN